MNIENDETYNYSKSKNHSNLRIFILSLVPLFTALGNIFLKHEFNASFLKNSSIFSLISLCLPYILRNYFEIQNSIDYKMIAFANMILAVSFIITIYTNINIRNFMIYTFQNKGMGNFMHLYISSFLDILITIIFAKPLLFYLKALTSLVLLIITLDISTISNIESNIFSFMLFVVPSCIIFIVTERKYKITSALTMFVMYCGFFMIWYYVLSKSIKYVNPKVFLVSKFKVFTSYFLKF